MTSLLQSTTYINTDKDKMNSYSGYVSGSKKVKYSYYLQHRELHTTSKKIANFYDYCISRRVNTKSKCAWTGITEIMITDIVNYCKRHDIDDTPELVADGLSCFSEDYSCDEVTNSIINHKNKEIWVKYKDRWTDELLYEMEAGYL